MGSGPSREETDPALQNEAIIIEKNQKLREKDAEIEQLRQEIERLQNSNRNQQEELAQTVTQLEEDLSDNSQLREQMDDLRFLLDKVVGQEQPRNQQNLMPNAQNAARTENKVEKQSGGQQNTSVLILGGVGYSGRLNTIYLLDLKAHCWKILGITLPVGMQSFGAVVLNEEIYIFGGYALNSNPQNDCYKLKDDGSWIKLASLNQERSAISSSSLVYKGDIWVIGGRLLNSVERYDISQNKWTYMPDMNYARYIAAAAVFNDRIFVTGGSKLKSVEMFDPKLQKWILFCDLPIEVSGHTMLISNSILSIFGGYSGSRSLNSVWEMDIEDRLKRWTEKQNFKYTRSTFGIGKLSTGIIIVSGDESGKTSEIFDGNNWIDGPTLPQKLSVFAYTSIPQSLEERLLKQFS